MKAYVVKNGTHDSELFDPLKLHASILSACMAVRAFEGEAHATAEQVCKHVIDWLTDKTEVTTHDIRRVTTEHLSAYHLDAAYIYDQQNMIV